MTPMHTMTTGPLMRTGTACLAALPECGVTLVIDPGCDVKSSRAAIELGRAL